MSRKLARKSKVINYSMPIIPDWIQVVVVHPFGGALARVLFVDREDEENVVSTYLDSEEKIGSIGHDKDYNPIPYFEISHRVGEPERFRYSEQRMMYERIFHYLSVNRKPQSERKNLITQNNSSEYNDDPNFAFV